MELKEYLVLLKLTLLFMRTASLYCRSIPAFKKYRKAARKFFKLMEFIEVYIYIISTFECEEFLPMEDILSLIEYIYQILSMIIPMLCNYFT